MSSLESSISTAANVTSSTTTPLTRKTCLCDYDFDADSIPSSHFSFRLTNPVDWKSCEMEWLRQANSSLHEVPDDMVCLRMNTNPRAVDKDCAFCAERYLMPTTTTTSATSKAFTETARPNHSSSVFSSTTFAVKMQEDGSNGMSRAGIYIGATCGIIALTAVVVATILYVWKRKEKERRENEKIQKQAEDCNKPEKWEPPSFHESWIQSIPPLSDSALEDTEKSRILKEARCTRYGCLPPNKHYCSRGANIPPDMGHSNSETGSNDRSHRDVTETSDKSLNKKPGKKNADAVEKGRVKAMAAKVNQRLGKKVFPGTAVK